jgi:uncharacterized glyoxalase superfamily protein PhnB
MENKAKIIGIAPQLVVNDVLATANYYCEILGFKLIGGIFDPPVYSMVERDGFQIHFGKADQDEFVSNTNFRKIAVDFMLWVPEIDSFFQEVRTKNAEIIQEIKQKPYGREFLIKDLNGYIVGIVD